MAGEWVKIRRGLRQHPKTIQVARHLAENRAFIDWWSDPVQYRCRHAVTEIVTFANVTRVTVCALVELWCVLNEVVGEDCRVAGMAVGDIDDMVEMPGFGEALLAVGWVVEDGEKGLVFPNFLEHNAPQKTRPEPKTQAQRAREYRARKRDEEARHARHETSQREEKRREEYITAVTTTPNGRPTKGSETGQSASSSSDFLSDDPREAWAEFRAAWEASPKTADLPPAIAKSLDPPRVWLDVFRSDEHRQALDALGQLAECRFFEKPIPLSQFLGKTWGQILAGGYREKAKARGAPDDKPAPKSWLEQYQPAPYRRPKEVVELAAQLKRASKEGE